MVKQQSFCVKLYHWTSRCHSLCQTVSLNKPLHSLRQTVSLNKPLSLFASNCIIEQAVALFASNCIIEQAVVTLCVELCYWTSRFHSLCREVSLDKQ